MDETRLGQQSRNDFTPAAGILRQNKRRKSIKIDLNFLNGKTAVQLTEFEG